MCVWKLYTGWFEIQFNYLLHDMLWSTIRLVGVLDGSKLYIIPLGISFNTFRGLDLLIKTYIGVLPRLGFERVLYYGFFPSVLMVGPIIEYEEVIHDNHTKFDVDQVFKGVGLISMGLFKIFVLGFFLPYAESILHTFLDYSSL